MKRLMVELPLVWNEESEIDYESLGIKKPQEVDNAVIDLNEITEFNSARNNKCTGIRFSSGDCYIVDMPYTQFKEYYCSMMNTKVEEIV